MMSSSRANGSEMIDYKEVHEGTSYAMGTGSIVAAMVAAAGAAVAITFYLRRRQSTETVIHRCARAIEQLEQRVVCHGR